MRVYLEQGEFSEALERVSTIRRQSHEQNDPQRLVRTALAIERSRSPLPTYQQEHLLRLALEALNEHDFRGDIAHTEPPTAEMPGEQKSSDNIPAFEEAQIQSLREVLYRFDAYESSRLRTAMIDLGRRLANGARWRSALQRRGHTIEQELEESDGKPDGDAIAETIALLKALGETGDSAVSALITRIRRESRVREIVEAAREAQAMLR